MLVGFLFLHLPTIKKGAIAQLVEQRTENPCVAGSIPAGTTSKASTIVEAFLFFYQVKKFKKSYRTTLRRDNRLDVIHLCVQLFHL